MENLEAKDAVILKLFSPMALWCFRKYFQNWHWNFLVVSCCLSIRLRSYFCLSVYSQRFTSGNLLSRYFGQCLQGSGRRLGGGPAVRDGETSQPWIMGCSLLWREKWFANVTSWDLLVKKGVFFPSHFPALNSLKSAWFLPGVKL